MEARINSRLATLTILVVFVGALASSCKKNVDAKDITQQELESAEVATPWADLTLKVFKESFRNSPTYSSRSLGYLGVCMYECVVHADISKRSLNGQLIGLTQIPTPETGAEYYWPLALNAGQETLLKLLYPLHENVADSTFSKITRLSQKIASEKNTGLAQATIDRSVAFGQQVAQVLYEWSKTDGGHKGFNKNFDPSFTFPHDSIHWVPPIGGQTPSLYPLHPYWGNNRTFVSANGSLSIPTMAPFSKTAGSECFEYYKAVYQKNLTLTAEEKEIAGWWTDDPTETFSPPGHSYNLATIAIKKVNANMVKAAETYARVGLAVADAFITCWKTKYTYFSARPSSFVRNYINSGWRQYWPEPPFPAFPSGHSTQSAAAAIVLTALYGDNFAFVDNSHEGEHRVAFPELKFKARSFSNFWASAEESGYSRFLGGIHTTEDNNTGLNEGKKVGANVNLLLWNQ
jgi:hypothetical protein